MAETVAVHKPGQPGSDMVVSRKQFVVDLQHEGFVEGRSDGTNPETPPTPPAQERPLAGQIVAGIDPARLQSLEERETAVALREVELDQREAELRDREAGPQQVTSDDLGGEPVPPSLTPPAPATAPAQPDPDAARKAARAAAERERRAKLRSKTTDGGQSAADPEQEGTP